MEQPEPSAPTTDHTSDHNPEETTTSRSLVLDNHVPTRVVTSTSNSVPSLRFPRPAGNRRLTNWVSSSQPDIMRPSIFPNDAPLDVSITDGYEVIGTDGESQSDEHDPPYEGQASELGDDVQSLADTDTGTDVYTNEVDTDSSDDEEPVLDHTIDISNSTHLPLGEQDAEIYATLVDGSLDQPTELFAPVPDHISRRTSVSDQDEADPILERATSAADLVRERAAASIKTPKPQKTTEAGKSLRKKDRHQDAPKKSPYVEAVSRLMQDFRIHDYIHHILVVFLGLAATGGVLQYYRGRAHTAPSVPSIVPLSSLSSLSPLPTMEIVVTTSTVTSTVTSTQIQSPHSLQTSSWTKSLVSIQSDLAVKPTTNLFSASTQGRNEILLKVPKDLKNSWISKQAIMISVSRDGIDLSSRTTNLTAIDEGIVIEVPREEAYGILDLSVVTTRKPKVKETFKVNFGSFVIVDAFDVGKQLMKGFAQSVVDTVNGTTSWVEEICLPTWDRMSKQATVPESLLKGLRDGKDAAASLGGQVFNDVKETLTPERLSQLKVEITQAFQDSVSEASLLVLGGQLNSKLLWLKFMGQSAEYERYRAAARPYYEKKQKEAAEARKVRAKHTKKEMRAMRLQKRCGAKKNPS